MYPRKEKLRDDKDNLSKRREVEENYSQTKHWQMTLREKNNLAPRIMDSTKMDLQQMPVLWSWFGNRFSKV